MLPQIAIDDSKCIGPHECGQCMKSCPSAVFIAGPTRIWKFRETDRADFRVYARYYDMCVSCGKCVEICPVEAITMKVEQPAVAVSAAGAEPHEASAEFPAPAD